MATKMEQAETRNLDAVTRKLNAEAALLEEELRAKIEFVFNTQKGYAQGSGQIANKLGR